MKNIFIELVANGKSEISRGARNQWISAKEHKSDAGRLTTILKTVTDDNNAFP